MRKLFGSILLGKRIQLALGVIILLFVVSFRVKVMFPIVQALFVFLIILALVDVLLLFQKNIQVSASRTMAQVLSLGDENKITIHLQNKSPMDLKAEVIDELPEQLQIRDFSYLTTLPKGDETQSIIYRVKPPRRGEYHFGDIQVITRTGMDLFARKLTIPAQEIIEVHPSIILMKDLELKAFSRTAVHDGIKKVRRIGVSYEFEQVSPYVEGDDIRHLNWKATGRTRELMVNRFEMERSQPIYSVICKTREMRMPFNGLSLLDHAVNTTLALSNIALLKYDKMGLLTFSDKVGSAIRADSKAGQLKRIMHSLYNEKERQVEANYNVLSLGLRQIARSLVFLFTNFESEYALDRALPHLRLLAKQHLLVTVFFKNTEIEQFADETPEDLRGIYSRTLARKMINEKRAIVRKLQRNNIQTILTEPENLAMNTVNKYLDLKMRGAV